MIGKIKNLFDKYISAGFPITKDEHQHFTKDEQCSPLQTKSNYYLLSITYYILLK